MTDKQSNSRAARVLIVEDEGIIAMQLERLLTRLGYTVSGMASSGEEALQHVVKEDPPDLALMDIKLAGKMDGVETAAHLHDQFDVPVVYLSAHPEEMVMEQVKRTQPYGFLSKPVRDQELQATVETALYKHQMEALLKLSEERFRMTIQRAPIGVGIVDSQGDLTDCNAALAEMLGYSREELLQLNFADFTHLDDLERERQLIKELWDGEQPQYRMKKRYICKDERVIWVDVAASLFKGETGKLAFGFAFVQDITERVRAEEERRRVERTLRKSEEQLAAIFECAPLAMMLLDRERRIHKINRAAAALDERPAEASDSLRFGAALRCIHALDDPQGCGYGPICQTCAIRNTVQKTFETGQGHHRVHATLTQTIDKPSETLHFLVSTTPMRFSDEEMVLAYIEDITQRKQAEEQLKAALAEKDTLLQEVYHRVKNNLQTLTDLIDLQIESAPHSETTRCALAELQGRVEAMALVHKQLYQAGDVSHIDFGHYVEELAVQIVQAMRNGREVQLQVTADTYILDVDVALPCGLIVNELLTNAMKYAFPERWAGQAQIRVAFETTTTTTTAGPDCVLTVSDNGVGLPESVDWQTSDSLGLKLVKIWAVHQLGGEINVDTQGGTTFTITFPR